MVLSADWPRNDPAASDMLDSNLRRILAGRGRHAQALGGDLYQWRWHPPTVAEPPDPPTEIIAAVVVADEPEPLRAPPPAPNVARPHLIGPTGATIAVRACARAIDLLVVALLVAPLYRLIAGPSGNFHDGFVWTCVVAFEYFVMWEVATGATPGKMIAHLHVVGTVGTPKTAAIRNSFWLLGIAPSWYGAALLTGAIGAVVVSIARSPDHLGIHDRIAGRAFVLDDRAPHPPRHRLTQVRSAR